MDKKEISRYFFVMHMRDVEEKVNNAYEENYLKSKLDIANKSDNAALVYSACEVEQIEANNYNYNRPYPRIIRYTEYLVLGQRQRLINIDQGITAQCEDENSLRSYLQGKLKKPLENKPISIGYKYNGYIRTLPIYYKQYQGCTNYEMLKNFLSAEIKLLRKTIHDARITTVETHVKGLSKALETLEEITKHYPHEEVNLSKYISAVKKFLEIYCQEGTNQRRVRVIGDIAKEYIEKQILVNPKLKPPEPEHTPRPSGSRGKKRNTEDDITLFDFLDQP